MPFNNLSTKLETRGYVSSFNRVMFHNLTRLDACLWRRILTDYLSIYQTIYQCNLAFFTSQAKYLYFLVFSSILAE